MMMTMVMIQLYEGNVHGRTIWDNDDDDYDDDDDGDDDDINCMKNNVRWW